MIVFDPKAQLFHFLNATAYGILKACNGFNSIKDIATMLCANSSSEDLDAVITDVVETTSQFRNKGLIMFVVDDPQLQQTDSGSTTDGILFAVSVTGASMFPVLLAGDKVLVKKTSIEELHPGNIVVWSDESGPLIAHRIVSIDVSSTPTLITTKSDLCVEPDPPVEIDRVLGRIVAVLRGGAVRWIRELDGNSRTSSNNGEETRRDTQESMDTSHSTQRPSYRRMQVLDLRQISMESIRNIESAEEIGLVLLSPDNAHAWADVATRDVKAILTVSDDYRVYTGQPELLPELLEFIQAPLRLVVAGQIFLTAFEPGQILKAFNELILRGQAYVSSVEAKTALESVTKIVSGEVCVVPNQHVRWIGSTILGPEYPSHCGQQPLVVIGDMTVSQRMDGIPQNISLFSNSGSNKGRQAEHR